MARQKEVTIPYSSMKNALAKVMNRHGFIGNMEVTNRGPAKYLKISLIYQNKTPKLTDIKIVSKPGKRIYIPSKKIRRVMNGLGIAIISTPQGVVSDREAKKKGIGGELICEMW